MNGAGTTSVGVAAQEVDRDVVADDEEPGVEGGDALVKPLCDRAVICEGGLLAAPHWVALGLRQRAAAGAERLRGHNGLGEAQDAVEGGANGSRTASSRLTRRRLVTTQGGRRAASSLDGRRVSGRSDGLLMPDACC